MDDIDCVRFTEADVRVRDDSMPLAHIAIAVEGNLSCSFINNLPKGSVP